MKILAYLGLTLLVAASASAQEVPELTIMKLQQLYPGQSRDFILARLAKAPKPFNKWRSFPPYYYDLIEHSPEGKKLKGRKGLCAGDPHMENFGFIYGSPSQFTINDLDDVTPCSLDFDLMRLFIGHRMLRPDLKASDFLSSYQNGFSTKTCPAPEFIKKLQKSSGEKGQQVSKKNKALRDSGKCTGDYEELTADEKVMLSDFNKAENGDRSCLQSEVLGHELKDLASKITETDPKVVVHACARTKDSGGSAGGRRLVVFRKWAAGEDAFELKPLVKPAPNYDLKKMKNSQRQKIYETAVKVFLGPEKSQHFYPVTLKAPGSKDETLYQRRPLWAGNEEIKESDLPKTDDSVPEAERLKNGQVKTDVMLFETCQLGLLHSRSQKKSTSFKPEVWESMAVSLEQRFKKEFGH